MNLCIGIPNGWDSDSAGLILKTPTLSFIAGGCGSDIGRSDAVEGRKAGQQRKKF
jgi:hypothetical protein